MKKLIPTSLETGTQLPLDNKIYVHNTNELLNLNSDSIFKYHEGIRVVSMSDNVVYIWVDINKIDTTKYKKIGQTYTYPSGLEPVGGINYSNRMFSFYTEIKASSGNSSSITNKDGGTGATVLDVNDSKLKKIKEGNGISITTDNNDIIIAVSNSSIGKFPLDKVVIDNTKPIDLENAVFPNMDLMSAELASGGLKVKPDATIIMATDATFKDPTAIFKNITIKNGSVLTFEDQSVVKNPIKIGGIGKVDLNGLSLQSKMEVEDVVVAATSPLKGDIESTVNFNNVTFDNSNAVKSAGKVSVKGSNVSSGTLMGRSTDATIIPIITMTEGSSLELDSNTIGSEGVIKVDDNNVEISLKNNNVHPNVTGNLITGAENASIISFGNILGNSNISENTNIQSTGDIKKGSSSLKLQEFESEERAYTSLGPGILYLLGKSDGEKTVAYTYER